MSKKKRKMANHKTRPKFNKFVKAGLLLKKRVQPLTFFSPALTYLSSKSPSKLKKYFQTNLVNTKRFKLLFGFYRTTLLRKFKQHRLIKSSVSRRCLKEIEFCSLVERRLDLILYRLGFVATVYEAKQLISHGKVKVNNLPSACFSRLLKKGDIISFEPSIYLLLDKQIKNQIKIRPFFFTTFSNLEVNYKTFKIIFLSNRVDLKKQLFFYSNPVSWKTS